MGLKPGLELALIWTSTIRSGLTKLWVTGPQGKRSKKVIKKVFTRLGADGKVQAEGQVEGRQACHRAQRDNDCIYTGELK
jgi:hypothetical protein